VRAHPRAGLPGFFQETVMSRLLSAFSVLALVVVLGLGLGLAGCSSQPPSGKDKVGDKMNESKMGDDKMKDNKMADDKMKGDKMADDKMSDKK
jgi:hypothetical protein